ncbi:DNA internalization-related competence protein ComEC/Rec2 [bacterium]|nr:DNA internalization-related competence protein ComEC/Rec2 [bacterium]
MTVRPPRPLALVACAFATGIVADSLLPLSLLVWVILLGAILFLYWFRQPAQEGTVLLLWATLAAGGAWHYDRTQLFASDDLRAFSSSEQRLCRVRGIVEGEVVVVTPSPTERMLSSTTDSHTQFVVVVNAIENNRTWQSASGRAAVFVRGELPRRESGDEVELVGWLSVPNGPMNPGEFDYRAFLESKRILTCIFVETPEAVTVIGSGSWTSFDTWREKARNFASSLLSSHLSESSARLADSLVLGIRSSLPPDELLPFLESGTIHVLVVSGLHVGLMAMLAWRLFGMTGLPLRWQAGSTILVIFAYTFLTGANPPAVRAGVLAAIFFGEYLLVRSTEPVNSLAASALIVLIADPSDLFRPGPQLSFLCAFVILAIIPLVWIRPRDSLQSPPWIEWLIRTTANLVISSFILWVVTAPLVAQQFHLFAPISVLGSVILIPLTTFTLYIAVAFFGFFWFPFVGSMLAWSLDRLLWLTSEVSRWTASWEALSVYVAGPPAWWVTCWYVLLILPWLWPSVWPLRRAHLLFLATCLTTGIVAELWTSHPDQAEYDQLAVGHGNAGVLRTPDGRCVLFDAGSITGPKVTSRVIAPFLWNKRVAKIDAIILSHADIDHFNGVVELARRFPIQEVFLPPSFARNTEPSVALILNELRRRQILVKFLWRGDEVSWDRVTLRVLHPPATFDGGTDNAASLVIRIENEGRSILSTGDVEGDGLVSLLGGSLEGTDVLIAPHHGASASNTSQLAERLRPKGVISSQGREARRAGSLDVYRRAGAKVFETNLSGCVSIRWQQKDLLISTFRECHPYVIGK